jgi:ketosteroid isomerase-like protein
VKPHLHEEIDRVYGAMKRRDMAALQQFGRDHPGFSWESSGDELDSPGRLHGAGLRTYWRDVFALFDELETEVLERIDLDPDHVVCLVRHRVRGATSGVRVHREEVHLWTAQGDRLESLREFGTVDEARGAAVDT